MPSERTFVTELSTALGLYGASEPAEVLARRPAAFSNLAETDWERLARLFAGGAYEQEFAAGHANGRAFFEAPDALRGRRPRLIEWTGGRRPPGDEVVPADLRIDHVYLVSCKYASKILHNPSPARLVEGLLATGALPDGRDWYARTAPAEYQSLYELCAAGVGGLPMFGLSLSPRERRLLASRLRQGWPEGAEAAYASLCRAVSVETARLWSARLMPGNEEAMLWRLLRIGAVPYFVLGTAGRSAVRLRVDTPWDWRQRYRLLALTVEAQPGGQPRVGWSARCEERASGAEREVRGHVEIRWSHGRFAQPPEAKVYLDSLQEEVPGYNPL